MQVSLGAARQYVLRYWWAVVGIPVFGLICMLATSDAYLRAFGAVCLLWPFTIPGRSFLLTSKAARNLLRPTVLALGDDALYFVSQSADGMKLPLRQIRSVDRQGDLYVVRTRSFMMIPVPADALLGDRERSRLEALGEGSVAHEST